MLEIKNINVFYRDLQALWDVSLTVNRGEIVTLVGSNGAGKSTILNTVAGLLKPRGGNIFFDGKRIDNLPAHRVVEKGISMIPEGRRLFPLMTVLDNLEVGASVAEARSKRHSSIGRVFELFPVLKQRAGQNASTLSGGEQQMLAIGRALMASPRLLLIDEMS
jgi:branched-chain amino acid transport system ATP-binding protein